MPDLRSLSVPVGVYRSTRAGKMKAASALVGVGVGGDVRLPHHGHQQRGANAHSYAGGGDSVPYDQRGYAFGYEERKPSIPIPMNMRRDGDNNISTIEERDDEYYHNNRRRGGYNNGQQSHLYAPYPQSNRYRSVGADAGAGYDRNGNGYARTYAPYPVSGSSPTGSLSPSTATSTHSTTHTTTTGIYAQPNHINDNSHAYLHHLPSIPTAYYQQSHNSHQHQHQHRPLQYSNQSNSYQSTSSYTLPPPPPPPLPLPPLQIQPQPQPPVLNSISPLASTSASGYSYSPYSQQERSYTSPSSTSSVSPTRYHNNPPHPYTSSYQHMHNYNQQMAYTYASHPRSSSSERRKERREDGAESERVGGRERREMGEEEERVTLPPIRGLWGDGFGRNDRENDDRGRDGVLLRPESESRSASASVSGEREYEREPGRGREERGRDRDVVQREDAREMMVIDNPYPTPSPIYGHARLGAGLVQAQQPQEQAKPYNASRYGSSGLSSTLR